MGEEDISEKKMIYKEELSNIHIFQGKKKKKQEKEKRGKEESNCHLFIEEGQRKGEYLKDVNSQLSSNVHEDEHFHAFDVELQH